MRQGKVITKIFGIALACLVIGAMVGGSASISSGITNTSDVYESSSYNVQAASLAEEVVGAPYLWGGKGYEWNPNTGTWVGGKFVDSASIKNGYHYYNPSMGTVTWGKGLDCSGLSFWAFNKAAGATKYVDSSNPVYYEGASGQWNDKERFEQISNEIPTLSDLKTGYLLFLDTDSNGLADHVGIYVGNGYVIHSRGGVGVEKKRLNDWLNLPVAGKKYEDYFLGYGRVKAADDYYASFLRMAQWLTTQQRANGGIQEAEDYPLTITDNTAESIWTWSCYAELTGDYITYLQNVNNAWDFCYANPSWEEGSSPTNYFTVYNVGWGLLAEMKYREVYEGRPGYIDHTWYGEQCANSLVNYTPGTGNIKSALCLGLAAGSLYQYGVNVNNSTYRLRAAHLGNSVRQWLEADISRFASESWAVSGGIAVWGVLNSYFQENSGGDAWAEEFAPYMPLDAHDGKNNSYEYGHDGWYAWGYYAVSKVLDSGDYYGNYRNIVDYVLYVDGDEDGGIPQGPTYSDNQDFAWVTNVAAFALDLGLLGPFLPGDFDADGDIDIFDFVQFADAYGSETGDPNYNAIGDFDDDGDIDIFDFVDFADVYGT